MTGKYWENETPQVIETKKNVLQFYPQARKLSVARPYWTDADGNQRQGKTVTLDLESLMMADCKAGALSMFDEILQMLKEG